MRDPAPNSYIICTSPRSGSTLLCHLLRATGVAGRPGSLFHVPRLDGWLNDYGLSETKFATHQDALRAVFAKAREKGAGGTALFGLRMQRPSFPFFMAQLAQLHPGLPNDRARIEAAFGPTLFVYLNRADKLDQAISRVKAEQTGLWHRAADGSELERNGPPAEPSYDAAAIAHHLDALTQMDAEWAAWFAAQKVSPMRIEYRALSANPRAELARILAALNLAPEIANQTAIPTAKLADDINTQWRERFRAGHAPAP